MLNIFICHYTKLTERKRHIEEQLSKLKNIKVHFINEYDKEDITEEINDRFFTFKNYRKVWNERNGYYIKANEKGRIITLPEKSLCLKHYIALKKILELNLDYALVIEDDIEFINNFINRLNIIMKNLPSNWNLYYPGGTKIIKYFFYKKSIEIDNDYLVKQPHPASLGTYSYLINKNCCQKIINEMDKNKIRFPIDFEYNWIFYKLKLNVYFNKRDILINHIGFKSTIR